LNTKPFGAEPLQEDSTMRVMLKVVMNNEVANRAVKEGRLGRTIEATIERIKPEAAYFTTDHGERTGYLVFEMSDSSQLPVIAEPLFSELGARVTVMPVMTPDDLREGLSKVQGRH
jgi:hypothetical protein